MAKSTVIVGAGPAGLAVAGSLKKLGQPFVLLDAAERVGAAWHHHYDRLHLHTIRQLSGLPHHAMPEDWPTYPSRAQVAQYLQDYADALGLEPRLGVRVQRAERRDDRWHLATDRGEVVADNLVVATGYNREPVRPTWPGFEGFGGEVVHSSTYKNGAHLVGKRVLVVGAGNSGAEIAIDLWEHDARPALCIRGPVHVVPRDLGHVPAQRVTVAMSRLPAKVADQLSKPLRQLLVGDLSPWGIHAPTTGPLELIEKEGRVPLIDVGTVALVKQGAIDVRPDIRAFHNQVVEFVDGRRETFDALVMATGYRAGLTRWIAGVEGVLNARGLPFLHGVETGLGRQWFCGFKNPTTGALREIAIEARRIAKAIARA